MPEYLGYFGIGDVIDTRDLSLSQPFLAILATIAYKLIKLIQEDVPKFDFLLKLLKVLERFEKVKFFSCTVSFNFCKKRSQRYKIKVTWFIFKLKLTVSPTFAS